MMVPRSYGHTRSSPSGTASSGERAPVGITTRKSRASEIAPNERSRRSTMARAPFAMTASPTSASKPVVIPSRTARDRPTQSKGRPAGVRTSSENGSRPHDTSSVSPSVSALLAMTAIPAPVGKTHHCHQRDFVSHIHGAMCQAMQDDGPRRTLSSSSPQMWDFLLGAPHESDMVPGSFESEINLGPSSSLRSFSTGSIPSLEEDEDSVSSCSGPMTPSSVSTSRQRRKSLSSPKSEDAVSDHPLLPSLPTSPVTDEAVANASPETALPRARPRSSFKSNLTASFHAIRSAARSLSAYSPPPPPETLLTHSLLALSLPYTVEKRPLPSSNPPEPAIRRYLNPITLSPAELHFHTDRDRSAVKSSIQLQTYQRGIRHSENASRPPIFTTSAPEPTGTEEVNEVNALHRVDVQAANSSTARQREPRENSDFLRIIVLEMNMRKVGKLGSDRGHAKLWLPARREQVKDVTRSVQPSMLENNLAATSAARKVPVRWTAMQA